jgi:hypothetical protein
MELVNWIRVAQDKDHKRVAVNKVTNFQFP